MEFEADSLSSAVRGSGGHVGGNGDPRLLGHGVGVDGDRLSLLVLLALGVEFDFNLSFGTRCDRLLRALRHRASAGPLAAVEDEGFTTGVGEREHVGHDIPFVDGAEVPAVLSEAVLVR